MRNRKNICGERIKRQRNALSMRQTDLAAALELEHQIILDHSDISEIENGKRLLKDYELNAIAIILNTSPIWLLRGD